jgi:hypothetical protein
MSIEFSEALGWFHSFFLGSKMKVLTGLEASKASFKVNLDGARREPKSTI